MAVKLRGGVALGTTYQTVPFLFDSRVRVSQSCAGGRGMDSYKAPAGAPWLEGYLCGALSCAGPSSIDRNPAPIYHSAPRGRRLGAGEEYPRPVPPPLLL